MSNDMDARDEQRLSDYETSGRRPRSRRSLPNELRRTAEGNDRSSFWENDTDGGTTLGQWGSHATPSRWALSVITVETPEN